MSALQINITSQTPLGANLIGGGATFRVWAPRAKAVFVSGDFNNWSKDDGAGLVKDTSGYWAGFVPGVTDGQQYKFYVVGDNKEGFKRDPYARELSEVPTYPLSNCIVRDPNSYPWHDQDYRTPAFGAAFNLLVGRAV